MSGLSPPNGIGGLREGLSVWRQFLLCNAAGGRKSAGHPMPERAERP